MKIKTLILTTALAFNINTASASKTVGDYGACISEQFFNEYVDSLNNKDENAFNYLISNSYCIITKPDIPVTVLDKNWMGVAKVRAYVGNTGIVLYTNVENVKD